jgi:hypothetical protein
MAAESRGGVAIVNETGAAFGRSADIPSVGVKAFAAAAVLTAPLVSGAQQQAPTARGAWPCGARLDTSYFQVAEGSGGHLLLLAPEEIADSATLLTAFGSHAQTIFRLAGAMTPGVHEFRVPVDPSVESVLFSISVQCLQVAHVLRPSGLVATGDDVTDLAGFRAQRMVIVKRPEPGVWTMRVSGTGVGGVVVQSRSAIGIAQVEFAPARSTTFTALPTANVENVVRIRMSGQVAEVSASVVSGEFRRIAELPLELNETDGSYSSRFTPGAEGFRILIVGKDRDGVTFQRIQAPLVTAASIKRAAGGSALRKHLSVRQVRRVRGTS